MDRGVASSLALLASIMILMSQISINVAFVEVVNEEVAKTVQKVVERARLSQLNLVVATEGSSIIVFNGRESGVSITSLSLCYINGSVVDLKVDWFIPAKSACKHHVPLSISDCVAVILVLNEGERMLLPVSKV
ncbi:MAG: hypothetical protein QW701_03825 [Candidatus Nezhaarchaeales archaeon]